ncbi:unnamed protein product [Cuscuta campestris]|uniref:Chromo domain-containing protein n=1 Tax=Cuscuta campestris TaxID=132261 RepID=A0A484KXI1_9ASTE|nr:unnamed protein product [Cuscuta campestris]
MGGRPYRLAGRGYGDSLPEGTPADTVGTSVPWGRYPGTVGPVAPTAKGTVRYLNRSASVGCVEDGFRDFVCCMMFRMSNASTHAHDNTQHLGDDHNDAETEASSFMPQQNARQPNVPLNAGDNQNFMTQFLQQMANTLMFQHPQPPQRHITFKNLKDNRAEEFLGDRVAEPQVALDWIEQVTRLLNDLDVPVADHPKLASQLLRKGAYEWRKCTDKFRKRLRPNVRPYVSTVVTTDFSKAYDLMAKAVKDVDDLKASMDAGGAGSSQRPSTSAPPSGKRSFGGSTLSYICVPMPEKSDIQRGDLEYPMVVSNPLGHSMRLHHFYRNCLLMAQEHRLSANLIELPYKKFDIILGMDWLTERQAIIDCGLRTVRPKTDDGDVVEVKGELFPKPLEFMSYMQAKRLIRKKCEAFLCHVRDTRKETPKQKDIPTPTQDSEIRTAQITDDFCVKTHPSHVLPERAVTLDESLTYEEEPVQILAREVKELRNKTVPLVKVLWGNHAVEEATWETEESMRAQYPQLFSDQ